MKRLMLATLTAAASGLAAAQSLSLSPAVVQFGGRPGQSTTQVLTVVNGTSREAAFELEARDVTITEGRRVFLAAGELPSSIAATAVFVPRRVLVPPGAAAAVQVTLTVPAQDAPRAVVALFRGTTRYGSEHAASTASLGTLLTFALTELVSLHAGPLAVEPQSAARNLTLDQGLLNDGAEPTVARGAAVLVNDAGALVGRAEFEPRRLLPGERVTLHSEYLGELPVGRYRALGTFEFSGQVLLRTADFEVP